jgi:hypothetical protein
MPSSDTPSSFIFDTSAAVVRVPFDLLLTISLPHVP